MNTIIAGGCAAWRPADVPGFIGGQAVGALLGTLLMGWLVPVAVASSKGSRRAP